MILLLSGVLRRYQNPDRSRLRYTNARKRQGGAAFVLFHRRTEQTPSLQKLRLQQTRSVSRGELTELSGHEAPPRSTPELTQEGHSLFKRSQADSLREDLLL